MVHVAPVYVISVHRNLKPYAIVLFDYEEGGTHPVEVIPSRWLRSCNRECLFPTGTAARNTAQIRDCAPAEAHWRRFGVEVIAWSSKPVHLSTPVQNCHRNHALTT